MSVVTQLNFISTLENSDNNNNNNNNNNTCILRLSTRSEEVNNNDNINNIEEDETAEIYINENEINDEVVEFISGSAWLLPQLFTEEEVEEIRETAQQHHSSVQHGLSYCYKACFDSEELSERISQRIQSALDSHSATLNKSKDDSSKEQLKIEKLIKQLRFITYPIGGYIGPHTDGIRVCPDTLQFSNLTLILYLQTSNTGETKFLRGDKENYSEWYSVIPRKGSVLIFNHNLLHMGVGVGHEGKVLLRGDIVAKGLDPTPTI